MAFNAGSILYVSTLNVGHSVAPVNTGSIDMTNGGQLVLADAVNWNNADTWDPGTGSGTVVYGKPDNQNIPSAFRIGGMPTYNNLIVRSLNTKTITGSDITVNGNLTIDAGTILSAGAAPYSIHVHGNWVNNGTFTSGGGFQTVYFDGLDLQNIGGTQDTNFNNLILSNTGGPRTVTADNNFNIAADKQMTVQANVTFYPAAWVIINGTGAPPLNSIITGAGTIDVTRIAVNPDLVHQYNFAIPSLAGTTVEYVGEGDQTVNSLSYGNLTTGGGSTKTLADNVDIYDNLSVGALTTLNLQTFSADRHFATGGTFSVANGAELRIGGFSYFPGNYTNYTLGPSSTVNYNLAGDQIINSAIAYGNLTTSGGTGIKTLQSGTTVNGNVIIGTGTTLDVTTSDHPLYVKGAWFNESGGSFNGRGGRVYLNGPFGGPASQIIYGATTFYNLTLNNVNNFLLNDANQTITGELLFTHGLIETGTNKIIIGPVGSVSGAWDDRYVLGNLQRHVGAGDSALAFDVGTASSFDWVLLDFHGVTVVGDLTVGATAGEHPNLGSSTINSNKDVNVYWSFTNTTIACTSYDARFNFNAGDIDVGANPANFIVGKWGGAPPWAYPPVGATDPNYIQTTGITTASAILRWGRAAGSSPARATLAMLQSGTEAQHFRLPAKI